MIFSSLATRKHPNIDRNNGAHTQTFFVIPVGEIFSTVGNNVPRDTMLGGERAGTRTHSGGEGDDGDTI